MDCPGWRRQPTSLYYYVTPKFRSDMQFFRHNYLIVMWCFSHHSTWSHGDLWLSCNIWRVLQPPTFLLPSLKPWCDEKWNVQHQTVDQKHFSRYYWRLQALPHFFPGECLRFLPLGRSWTRGCCTPRDATEGTDNFTHPLLLDFFPLFFPSFSYSRSALKKYI